MFWNRPGLLVAIDYFARTSPGRIPWRMTVDARGRVQWVVVREPVPAVQEKRLTPDQVKILRNLVRASVSGDVPNPDREHVNGE